ncbi:MAG TPA: DNA repair protein RadA [Fibrobacteraceae bacterium]|jgi:DNA repair protein RadA/Sms|nr:DNA repair protein RadA [Fibrobacter sp.]HPW95319.1 DNA repair protein RadA [Fibrobacteraceae bacterium]
MAKNKTTIEYVCKECSSTFSKWSGKCSACGAWSTLEERIIEDKANKRGLGGQDLESSSQTLKSIQSQENQRLSTGNSEFDRTLGGGLAPGSLILIGGDPGIGKSTLVLQTLATMSAANVKTLYVSGEESAVQVKIRSERLELSGSDMLLMCETNLEKVLAEAKRIQPEILVIDSIQTVYKTELPGTPGSVTQLRECTLELMVYAKNTGCITILVGHVTKDGQIAGPRILEHMVDTVAYFEGDRNHQYRVLRTIKNRFGATDEIGVFEMTSRGLEAVENPSKVFLQNSEEPLPGSVISCTLEGTRALLFETQALVSQTNYAVPQRVAAGIDPKRLTIILALLEKFASIRIGSSDVFASIAGGLKVNDAGTDLALALAIASNLLSIPMPKQSLVIGELGLSGEVRSVNLLEWRIKEAMRLGFGEILIPASGKIPKISNEIKITKVAKIQEAVDWLKNSVN